MKKDNFARGKILRFLTGRGERGATDEELGALLGITGGPPDMVSLVLTRFTTDLPGVVRRRGVWLLEESIRPEASINQDAACAFANGNGPSRTDIHPGSVGPPGNEPVPTRDEKKPAEEQYLFKPDAAVKAGIFDADPASPWARAVSLQLVHRQDKPGSGVAAVAVAGRGTPPRLIPLATPVSGGARTTLVPDLAALAQLRDLLDGAVLVTFGSSSRYLSLRDTFLLFGERAPAPSAILALDRVAGALLELDPRPGTIGELVSTLAHGAPTPETPEESAAMLLDLFLDLRERLEARGINSDDRLSAFSKGAAGSMFDYSGTEFDASFLESLPETPGVYRMRDKSGNLLYVGKAVRLRERVSSYFTGPAADDSRVGKIREMLHGIETDLTGNELEALLEEHRAIRSENPLLNVQMAIHPFRDHPFTRSPTRIQDKPVVVFLPSGDEGMVSIFAINSGKGFARISAGTGGKISASQANRIWRTVSPSRRKKDRPFDDEMEIVLRWIESNLDYHPHIPVAAMPGKARLTEVVNAYLAGASPEQDGGIVLL